MIVLPLPVGSIPDDVLVASTLAMAMAAIEPEPGVDLGERKHLQPTVIAALKVVFGTDVVQKDVMPAEGFPDWSSRAARR
jgi:hypothetical protein